MTQNIKDGPFETLTEAKQRAKQMSLENPGAYVTLYACFGIFVEARKRLHIFSPSDSCCDSYWLNGKEKKFTEAQRIADQQATPTLT